MYLEIRFDEQSVYKKKKKLKETSQLPFQKLYIWLCKRDKKVFYVLTHSFTYMEVKQGQTSVVQVLIRSDQITAS